MQVHPVSLGIFNFVNAWSMMFWPVMLADRKGQAVKQRFPLWFGTQAMPSLFLQIVSVVLLEHSPVHTVKTGGRSCRHACNTSKLIITGLQCT